MPEPRIITFDSPGELERLLDSTLPGLTIGDLMREMGRRGGRVRNPKKGFGSMTKTRRREIARAAATKRWTTPRQI